MLCNHYDRTMKNKYTQSAASLLDQALKRYHIKGVGDQVELCTKFKGSFYVYQNNLIPGEAGALATKKVAQGSVKVLPNLKKPKGR